MGRELVSPKMLSVADINKIGVVERSFPEFRVGDTVEVELYVVEGGKKRIQKFTGDVIAFHRNGASTTFTVRKLSANGVFVERILPYYSPSIAGIRLVRRGKVRRAKLYYLRDRIGKRARVKENLLERTTVAEQNRLAREKAEEAAKGKEVSGENK